MKEENKDNLLERLCIAFSVLFSVIILSVIVLFAVSPKREKSETENRVLAQMPQISFSSIADGSFMKEFESFLTDQFPFRDKIISAKTFADLLSGKKEVNGVYIGKNGFLFEKQSAFDKKQAEAITGAMSEFAQSHKKLKTAAVISPNSSCVLSELLPYGVVQDDQTAQLKKIKKQLDDSKISWIDCDEAFENQKDKTTLFYRTDHHWTTRAAYESFLLLAKQWGLDTKKHKNEFLAVSDTFQGTLSSMSGINSSFDEIEVCVPKDKSLSYVISYEKEARKSATFFATEKLKQKNQYEVFLDGNYDKVVISTNADNLNTLLIFKDSYANCMIPMFAPYFSKIVVVDPRYYSDNLSKLMKEYDFTHCVYIYNLNTFLKDTSLKDVLES